MPLEHDNEFFEYVLELAQVVGPVKGRKMFGGYGLFLDKVMFALIADDVLYFKVNGETIDRFEEHGLGPFLYQRGDKEIAMSYHQAPGDALEDADIMRQWAELACEAAFSEAGKKG